MSHSVISPIDGKSMESISSTKMFQKSEYKENGKIIHWTEVQMLIFFDITAKSSEIVFLTCSFGAGVLSAKRVSAQRRSKWLRGAQSAYRTDRPGLLLGIVSTPQTAERGWDGQTGPAYHFWITRGQRARLLCSDADYRKKQLKISQYI